MAPFTPLSLFQSNVQPTTPDYTTEPLVAPDIYSNLQPRPDTSGAANYGGGYANQLDQMLAPYQQMASRFTQPYNAFQPNSLLGRLIPQGAQGALSNAILAGSMVPQGATIGQNISGVMQGLVGANQFERQRMLQGAMLPYEMIEPRLKAEDTLAQIQERQQEIPYRQAMEQRAMAQSDWYMRRMNEPNAEALKMNLAASMAGIKNFNGDFSTLSPDDAQRMGKALDDITMRQANASLGSGLTPGHIVQMLISPDPNVRAQGQQAKDAYIGLTSGAAGAGAGARKGAEQPQIDVDQETKLAESEFNAPKPMTPGQYAELNKLNPDYLKDPTGTFTRYQAQATQAYQTAKQQYDQRVSQYRDAARKNPNLRWHDFLQQGASGGPTPGGPTGQSAPSVPSFSQFMSSRNQ